MRTMVRTSDFVKESVQARKDMRIEVRAELMTDDCTIVDAHHDAASQSPSKDRQD